MKKKIFLAIIGLIVLVGAIGGIKALQIGKMVSRGKNFAPPPETVTTARAKAESWESAVPSVGSLEAVQGVMVTAEVTGKIVRIAFEPGKKVESGDLLLQQDTSLEEAQLRAAEASATLARADFERIKELLSKNAISRSQYDNADAKYKSAIAEADGIRAVIEKKNIRAPFAGRLGIRLVNLGQLLKEGGAIVSLQALDPIFVNFLLPQKEIARIGPGMTIRVETDALPGKTIEGKITAINPEVDAATRNIRIQATMDNPEERLRPGMYVNVAVVMPDRQPVVVIPETAVLYAPYSDSVFVVAESKDETTGKTAKVLRQQFVRLGEKRGDFAAVVSGLEEGDTVASTGVFKLRNGQSVVVDNTLSPEFQMDPKPENN